MKCPVCENETPPGRFTCTRCGAPLPSVGGHSRPGPGFAFGPLEDPRTESANPKTEPLPIPVWDMDEHRRWDLPPDRFASPGPDPFASPGPDPVPTGYGPATQRFDAPNTNPIPPEYEPPAQRFDPPVRGPIPPGRGPVEWNAIGPSIPGEAAGSPTGGHTGRNLKIPLLAGGIAAASILGAGLAYALTHGFSGSGRGAHTTGAKPAAGSAVQQAAAVDQILRSGRTARGHLPSRLRTCDDVAAGVPGFRAVVRDRQQELSRSRRLEVTRLQNGPALRQSMIAAYQSSLDADQAYLAWAQEVKARGCGGRIAPLTAHYKDALAANDKAGPAKRRVVALWRPIARSQSLPAYAWNRL